MPKSAPIKEVKTEENIRIEHIDRTEQAVPIGFPYKHPEKQLDGAKPPNMDAIVEISLQNSSHSTYSFKTLN